MGPNAVITNRTQQKSKMSELAHANIGKIYCLTNADRPRAIRTIGGTQPSCVKPDHWQKPRRNRRGGVVGNMHRSAHAEFVKIGTLAQKQRTSKQISWRLSQGGVVGRSWWPSSVAESPVIDHRVRMVMHASSVVSKLKCLSHACCVSECLLDCCCIVRAW